MARKSRRARQSANARIKIGITYFDNGASRAFNKRHSFMCFRHYVRRDIALAVKNVIRPVCYFLDGRY